MKYKVVFNDGELIMNNLTLDEAIKLKSQIFHQYISRYAIILDNKGNKVRAKSKSTHQPK